MGAVGQRHVIGGMTSLSLLLDDMLDHLLTAQFFGIRFHGVR